MATSKKTVSKDTGRRVAERFLLAMAYDRRTYKDKVESPLVGAIIEFYKARLAKKNGQSRWVKHWMTEVRQHIETKLVIEILHSIRGFKDRRKAYAEVVSEVRASDQTFRTFAENTIVKDYKLPKLGVRLGDDDTAAFWALVEKVAEGALASTE